MKKTIPFILLIVELYILFQNLIIKGLFWGSLEIKLATSFSFIVLVLLLILVFKPDLFSFLKENDILYKSYKEFMKNKGGVLVP